MSTWVIIPLKEDLQHHGIEGQKWGVRNGPPYPIKRVNKKSISKRVNDKSIKSKYPHLDSNLEKWGKTEDTNILWITGISGSGKSTIAKEYSKKYNADLIDIDLYTFKTADKYMKDMSKSFNKYLDENVPNWKKLQKEGYEALTKTDRRLQKKAGLWFDTFEEALKGYGKDQFGKQKVVAEGVQILDETLFYKNKSALRNQPLIIMETSIEDAIASRIFRDNKSLDKLLTKDRVKQFEVWLRDKDALKAAIR